MGLLVGVGQQELTWVARVLHIQTEVGGEFRHVEPFTFLVSHQQHLLCVRMQAPPTNPPAYTSHCAATFDFDSIKKNILESLGREMDLARSTLLNLDFTTDNSIASTESVLPLALMSLHTPLAWKAETDVLQVFMFD